ncbi:MAG TPA: hypothetical protein VEC14_11175, partial [Reyranellaceae bacterium]|nr:hypothetical protein [Reyranellaceae bacterium]
MTIEDLLKSSRPITVLLEAQNSNGPVYVSNTGYATEHDDATAPNRAYPEWLAKVPRMVEELPDDLVGRSSIGWSDAVIANDSGEIDDWGSYAWDGYAVQILIGAEDWPRADFVPVFAGVCTGIKPTDDGGWRLQLTDHRELLDGAVQETLMGTGPNANEPMPLVYGEVFNIEPVLVDASTHTYRVHEDNPQSIDAVRAGGLPVGFTNNGDGTFSLTANPQGARITCDVKGAKVDGVYITRADQILRALAARRGVAAFDDAALAALASARPETLGRQIKGRTNALEVIDEIVESVSAWCGFNALNQFSAGVIEIGDPVMELIEDDIDAFGLEGDDIV